MLRLSYRASENGQQSVAFDAMVIRFGTDPQCDLRLRPEGEAPVQRLHGEFISLGGAYAVVGHNERCQLWVNGKQVHRANLRGGDHIRVGSPAGPEIHVVSVGGAEESVGRIASPGPAELPTPASGPAEIPASVKPKVEAKPKGEPARSIGPASPAPEPSPPPRPEALPSVIVAPVTPKPAAPPPTVGPHKPVSPIAGATRRPSGAEVQRWLSEAEEKIQQARQGHEGQSSGQTMMIVAEALTGLRKNQETRVQKSRSTLLIIGLTSVTAVVCLGAVIWVQQQRITQLVKEKAAIDSQIQSISEAMEKETDETRLEEMEGNLETLMGSAKEKVALVNRTNPKRAHELSEPPDEFERDLRKLLKSFNAETYVIPPNFKAMLHVLVGELADGVALQSQYARRQKYWKQIQAALERSQLPRELGYITFTESRFDPSVRNERSGAAGMWQLMPLTARQCGLTVSKGKDERYDPARSSTAAACYLSKLLVEFGEESFMLVLASYNRGENGVRAALHTVAKEPGGYKKRDFWHLYRLKLLPPETRDYVPRVLAAALVFENPKKYGLPEDP